mmetsp:Transcript_148131/g.258456  ORF Transcript_148131/g.258456 Transcript_148131/m.258456 type:complete len:256 (-) Transcript_148131:141-908(-)
MAPKKARARRKLNHSDQETDCPLGKLGGHQHRSSGIALVAGLGPKSSIYGRDAKTIAATLEKRGYDTTLCIERRARKHVIRAAFEELSGKAWPGCKCVIYVGAHADEDRDGQMKILPVERFPGNQSEGIDFDWLRSKVTGLPVQRTLLLIDCCCSGLFVSDSSKCSKRLWKERSLVIVTSCDVDEQSCCYASEENSPFAEIVTATFSDGTSPRPRGDQCGVCVSAIQLANSVQTCMPMYEDQTPLLEIRGPDFRL